MLTYFRLCFFLFSFLSAEGKPYSHTAIDDFSVWNEFESYMENRYISDFLRTNKNINQDDLFMTNLKQYAILQKQHALKMIRQRKKNKTVQSGDCNLATIAASCDRYDWMWLCLKTGDTPYPEEDKNNDIYTCVLTLIISGLGDIKTQHTVDDRIHELEKLQRSYPHLINERNIPFVHFAAQVSGTHLCDSGKMYDYLISNGLPLSPFVLNGDKQEPIKLILSIPDSLWIIKKYNLLENITIDKKKELLIYINNSHVSDRDEKIKFIHQL